MDDSTLLKFALICSFLGLVALFSIMYFSVIPEKSLNNITEDDLGSKIKISGDIERIRISSDNQTTFITLSQKCSIDVISFDAINLSKGQKITVEGAVQEYQNKKEIIAEKIIMK